MAGELPEYESPAFTMDSEHKYSNYFQIGHNAFEFLFDFGQSFSDDRTGKMHTRIITGPYQAKEFLGLLEQSVRRYEDTFGPVVVEKADGVV